MTLESIDFEELEKQLDPGTRMVIALLRKANNDLLETIKAQSEQNSILIGQIDDLRQMLFGRKSEKMPSMESEVRRRVEEEELFGGEDSQASVEKETEEEKKTRRRKKARAKSEKNREAKRKLKKNLPVIHEKVLVTGEQLPEGYKLEDFREVAPDADSNIIRRIDHVREHLVVVEYALQTLASKDNEHIVTAPAPPAVVEGGHYGPGVYADVVVNKCVDSLPLYRIERRHERSGFPISRSTLCSLFHRTANIFEPVYNRLLDLAKNDPYVNADETRLPVQKPGGCKDEWIWTLVTKAVIAYYFSETRGGQTPRFLLNGTKGYLQIDGYSAYNVVCEENGRTRVGCMSHARRMFFKASKKHDKAKDMLDLILELYMVEYLAAEKEILGTSEHLFYRRTESQRILDKMKKWLDENKPLYPPKGQMGKAIGYAQNQWDSLCEFTKDAKLRLDNNISENALRIVALGRKNYLFAGHEEGGQNLAILQTIVATCKLHDINPYDYIKDVIIKLQLPQTKDIEPLLPQNWGKDPPG
jgi:transposase